MPNKPLKDSQKEMAEMLRKVADAIEAGTWGSLASVRTIAHLADVPFFADGFLTNIKAQEQCGATLIVSTLADPRPELAKHWLLGFGQGIGIGAEPLYPDRPGEVGIRFGSRAP